MSPSLAFCLATTLLTLAEVRAIIAKSGVRASGKNARCFVIFFCVDEILSERVWPS